MTFPVGESIVELVRETAEIWTETEGEGERQRERERDGERGREMEGEGERRREKKRGLRSWHFTGSYTCISYNTPARLVIKEEEKENPDPIHHTKTIQT